jgi:hypothetical protein
LIIASANDVPSCELSDARTISSGISALKA